MCDPATIMGVASIADPVIGGLMGSDASKSASNTQSDAANNAANLQMQMFQQQQANLAPWMQAGGTARNALMGGLGLGGDVGGSGVTPGQFTQPFNFSMTGPNADPSYLWRVGQGEDAILNKQSALGGVMGGNTLKALTNYGQQAGSQEYGAQYGRWQDYINTLFNRLNTVSGSGLNAAGGTANLGMAAAGQAGNYGTQAANASAAGTIGSANALTGGMAGASNNWLVQQMINNQQQQNQGGTNTGILNAGLSGMSGLQPGGYSDIYGYTVPGQTGY